MFLLKRSHVLTKLHGVRDVLQSYHCCSVPKGLVCQTQIIRIPLPCVHAALLLPPLLLLTTRFVLCWVFFFFGAGRWALKQWLPLWWCVSSFHLFQCDWKPHYGYPEYKFHLEDSLCCAGAGQFILKVIPTNVSACRCINLGSISFMIRSSGSTSRVLLPTSTRTRSICCSITSCNNQVMTTWLHQELQSNNRTELGHSA